MMSLRTSIGSLAAVAAFGVGAVAGLWVVSNRWEHAIGETRELIELESFRFSEAAELAQLTSAIAPTNGFVAVFNEYGEVVHTTTDDSEHIEIATGMWSEVLVETVSVSYSEDTNNGRYVDVAGVRCANKQVCDTIVVGAEAPSFSVFLWPRLPVVFVVAAVAAALMWLATRSVIGRALRPVEAMGAELNAIAATRIERRVPVPPTGDEIERLATTLNGTLDRLQAAQQSAERFAADAAHELRSPLTGVRAALELRATDDSLLNDAIRELDRASGMVDDLLYLARNEAVPTERQEVDLDDIARSAVASQRVQYEHIEFSTELQPVRVAAYGSALERLVTNLVANAARYGKSMVRVTVEQAGNDGRIIVDDDGPGIAVEHRDIVFERFARVDDSRARASGGTGLGLAIVADIVAAHQGSIAIEDSGLGGARLVVVLPTDAHGG